MAVSNRPTRKKMERGRGDSGKERIGEESEGKERREL